MIIRKAALVVFCFGGMGLFVVGGVKFNVLFIVLGVVSLFIGLVIAGSTVVPPAPPAQEIDSPTQATTDETATFANVERRLRGMGLSEKEIAQRLETIKAGIETLRGVKITPGMAAWAQQELGKQVPGLLEQLKDTEARKRASAAEILGNAGDASKSVVTALIHALGDSDFRVLTSSVISLNKLDSNWTRSVDAGVVAPQLASAIIDNKQALDYTTKLAVIDAVEKMDSARGQGLRMLLEFEQGIDSAVRESSGLR